MAVAMSNVNRPKPGYVPGTRCTKDGDDVPPGSYEHRWRRMPVTPVIPVTVHLRGERKDHPPAKGFHRGSVGAQVSVIPSRCDRGKAHPCWVDLHYWRRTVPGCFRRELGLERLLPSAVVHHQVWPDVGGRGEGSQPGVGLRYSDHEYPKVRQGLGASGRRRSRGIGAAAQANQRNCGHGNDRGPECHNPRRLRPVARPPIRARLAGSAPETARESSQPSPVLTEPAGASRRSSPVAGGAPSISQSRGASHPFASPLSRNLCYL